MATTAYEMIYAHAVEMQVVDLQDDRLEYVLASNVPRVAWVGGSSTEGTPETQKLSQE